MITEDANDKPAWRESLFENRRFLKVAAAGFLLLSVLARFFLDEHFRDPVGACFDALFVAAFLALAVDPVLKRGFFKGATKDVFALIYGYSLPAELHSFFITALVGAKVIRRRCKLEWTMTKHPTAPERVSLGLHASFNLVNFRPRSYVYTHEVAAISDAPGENGSVETMYCKVVQTDTYHYHCDKHELVQGKNSLHPGKTVPLGPGSAEDPGRFRVGVHYSSESALLNGVDQFSFSELTTDLEVVVSVDKEFRGLLFSLIPSSEVDEEPKTPELDPQEQTYRCRWHFNRVFVPNESLILRWQAPAPTDKPATTQVETVAIQGA